jgi:hypothetical protein
MDAHYRLTVVLQVAEESARNNPNRSALSVLRRAPRRERCVDLQASRAAAHLQSPGRAALRSHRVEAASASTDRATASLLAHRSGIVLQ